ncbi:MAG: phosphate/phosphite/phosphonate ABC transporter substrate-binding protein [Ignavibacteriaceae bacterium]|nr:phosphate/phosphite/phosphonate ABC transporter substrate-binding protein [Ignavibacteriaceae bacterium]
MSGDKKVMQKKKLIYSFLFLLAGGTALTVFFYGYFLDISGVYTPARAEYEQVSARPEKPVVYIGVISRYPPNIIYRGYQPMLEYLTANTPYHFELKLSTDYNEAVQMLVKGETAAAFLGSYVYIKAREKHRVIPILKPLNENYQPYSRSVLITHKSSGLKELKDLKGKRLALPSQESFSGNWLISYELGRQGIKVSDIAEIQHFPHHQSVIYQVASRYFDAGVTREFLVNSLQNRDSIRIILYSEKIPTSPLVAAEGYDQNIINAISAALLMLNRSNQNLTQITRNWDSEFKYGFEKANDADYDFIRLIER